MKNRKAFTLIELMAVVVILGLIMMIAIPNTLSMIDKNKKTTYIENAKTFVSLVQNKVRTNKKLEEPENDGMALVVTLEYLSTSDVEFSPYGEEYDKSGSFVAIVVESNKLQYYVHLVSCSAKGGCSATDRNDLSKWRGIELVNVNRLNEDDRFDLIRSSDVNVGLVTPEQLGGHSLFQGKIVYVNETLVS